MDYRSLSHEQLEALDASLTEEYETFCAEKLNLDLTRGKPASEQLDLSSALDGILGGFYLLQDGTDVRNYGGILGIPEARALGGEILDLPASEVLVGGNSSLTLMYLYLDYMNVHAEDSWSREAAAAGSKIKFLCPVPGYDRHFTICEHLDIEMITVPLTDDGPDMDQVESPVASDPLIKGIWCVPKYSNPTGQTYSDETVSRLAALPSKAGKQFRIMWDNAYAVHDLTDNPDRLANLMEAARNAGTADSVIMLASTSKVTFAGAGISFFGAIETNLKAFEHYLSAQIIGFDKVNQLRHVRFLRDRDTLAAHMSRHAEIIKPKFDRVLDTLDEKLGDTGIAEWTRPRGGYFISVNTLPGLASDVVKLAAEAGVKLTPAGATFPYGVDPENSNIRIAPTFPSIDQLDKAMQVFVTCISLASVRSLLSQS
ncbi:MAG: aminotransferase class I/II-fold pyridoxal phosphate-dependent enzyme [Gammaproteobacteria bacterium]|nr:aminotransferase class I/II-fold pyridoxal phosphate-dependent enzyme [Gammaproteobacteria bacterium]